MKLSPYFSIVASISSLAIASVCFAMPVGNMFWRALDSTPPPVLTGFSGATGAANGEITLTVDFPADVSDYAQVDLRRASGATAPVDCTAGTVEKTYLPGQFTDGNWTNSGLVAGSYYSYRACIYDGMSNLTGTQVAQNIKAKAPCAGTSYAGYCWYEGANGANCTTTCATHGGYDPATGTYAGSGGVFANCVAVWTALGRGALANWGDNACSGNGAGCIYAGGNKYRCTPATAEGFGQVGNVRACACNS